MVSLSKGSYLKSVLGFGWQRQASAAVIDGCDEVLGTTESERPVTDRLDLIVHTLNCSIGTAASGPSQDARQVGPKHTGELFERLQLRAHGRREWIHLRR